MFKCPCGKHVMKHWVGRVYVGYIHYDYTPLCKGARDESQLVAGLPASSGNDVLLGEHSPSNTDSSFDLHSYKRNYSSWINGRGFPPIEIFPNGEGTASNAGRVA